MFDGKERRIHMSKNGTCTAQSNIICGVVIITFRIFATLTLNDINAHVCNRLGLKKSIVYAQMRIEVMLITTKMRIERFFVFR